MNSANVDEEQFNQLLATSGQWPTNDLPVEDLTGEVQDLMMRYTKKNFFFFHCPANQKKIFFFSNINPSSCTTIENQ